MKLGNFYKIKALDPYTLETAKDILSRNGITWGQKEVGKPLHVWSLYNKESLEYMLEEGNCPECTVSQKKDREFNSKDFSSVFFNEQEYEVQVRTVRRNRSQTKTQNTEREEDYER